MMNQEDIFKKIGQILTELNEQYQYLAQNPRELNELELELFLANSKFLSDHVQIIRKLNSSTAQKVLPEHTASSEVASVEVTGLPHHKPALEQEIFKLDNEPASFEFILSEKPSTDHFDFEEKPVGEIFDRPLSIEEEQIIAQKQKLREMDSLGIQALEEDEIGPEPFLVAESQEDAPVEEDGAEEEPIGEEPIEEELVQDEPTGDEHQWDEPVKDPVTEQEPIIEEVPEPIPVEADLITEEPFMEEPAQDRSPVLEPVKSLLREELPTLAGSGIVPKPTLNDILSGNSAGKNMPAHASRPAINDLKQAINLNDKMRYIKDLFNGYSLAYAEAIDLLNKMPDFKTADSFLQHNYAVKNNWASKQDTADQFYELLNQRFPAAK